MNARCRKKILDGAAYSVILVAWLIGALVLWSLLVPIDPGTTIESIKVPESVKAGESFTAEISYCKTVGGPVVSTYSLVTSERVVYFDPVTSNRPVGCDTVGFEVTVPVNTPAGVATYDVDILRQYNFLNSEIISAKSNPFTITAADDPLAPLVEN
jgi:hypothetical protein